MAGTDEQYGMLYHNVCNCVFGLQLGTREAWQEDTEPVNLFGLHLQEHIAAQLADRSNIEKYLTTIQTLYTK